MIFKGDIGTKIILNTGSDLSTGTVFKIYYHKPDGTTGSWTAQKESDNLSISYTTLTLNDLNVVGTWVLQSYVEISGWKGFGVSVNLIVGTPVTEIVTPAETTYDTSLQGMLNAVDQAIAAILAGGAVQSYSIGGRNIQKMSLA
ncbi:MAG: hypothetical protein HZB36_00945, partial [Candidatus Omnitrophica bacterium]|nr:hypothetical protein [Candidatus Omnitrophota bacterium]